MNKSFYTNVDLIGNTIYCREIKPDGSNSQYKIKYEPKLYTPTNNNTAFANIYGNNLTEKTFDNVWDAKQYIKANRKLFKIHGNSKWTAAFITDNYEDVKLSVNYTKICGAITDIEVYCPDKFPAPDEALWPINAITTYDTITKKFYTFHLLDKETNFEKWSAAKAIKLGELPESEANSVVYSSYDSETELLKAWISFFSALEPHYHSGWNSTTFDTTYTINRIKLLLSDAWVNRLSPWGKVIPISVKSGFGEPEPSYRILGVEDLDYLNVFKDKTFTNQEKYSLDHIAHVILGERKISYDEAEGLHGLYKSDPQKFISYNIKDVSLILRMDKKLNLFNITQSMAYYAGVNYTDTYSPIRIWESTIFNFLIKQNIVSPTESHQEQVRFPGGYVKNPQVGLYEKLASFDLTSLYPSIIRQWNISADTIEENPDNVDISQMIIDDNNINFDIEGYSLCGNNVSFKTNKQGFMSVMMEKLFNERYQAKQEMLQAKQNVVALEAEISKRGLNT